MEQLGSTDHTTLSLLDGITYELPPLADGHARQGVALSRLSSSELATVVQAVNSANAVPADDRAGAAARLADYSSNVDEAFFALGKENIDAAAPAILMLARSERPIDRHWVGTGIVSLLTRSPKFHETGLEVWHSLLFDDDPKVREATFSWLWDELADSTDGVNAQGSMAGEGLSWSEAIDLMDRYIQARAVDRAAR
jgi:hypothetical protein